MEEASTIMPTVWAFGRCEVVGRVIVVDDGLSPAVLRVLHQAVTYFGRDVVNVVTGPQTGKGQAVMRGLEYVTAPRVTFCDADLHGMKVRHAWLLTASPIVPNLMIIGVTEYKEGLYVPWPVDIQDWIAVSGERSLPIGLLEGLDLHGYGMEVQINAAALAADIPIVPIDLPGVHGTARWNDRRKEEMAEDGKWLKSRGIIP
jgi:glycosyltransferase involved in cell wall biosynthesis